MLCFKKKETYNLAIKILNFIAKLLRKNIEMDPQIFNTILTYLALWLSEH